MTVHASSRHPGRFTRQAITLLVPSRQPSATTPAYPAATSSAATSSTPRYTHETSFPVLSVIALVLGLSTLAVALLYASMYWMHKRRRDRVEIVEVVHAPPPERVGTAKSEAALAAGGDAHWRDKGERT
jgi:hypothetical protein